MKEVNSGQLARRTVGTILVVGVILSVVFYVTSAFSNNAMTLFFIVSMMIVGRSALRFWSHYLGARTNSDTKG
jgi:hypothetical protein